MALCADQGRASHAGEPFPAAKAPLQQWPCRLHAWAECVACSLLLPRWNDGSCGRIVQLLPHATPWSLLVRTSQGVMRKTGAIKSRHPIPRLRYDPLARARCHDYMPRATCAWAVARGMCSDKRWNMTNCPTLCGHAVCTSQS